MRILFIKSFKNILRIMLRLFTELNLCTQIAYCSFPEPFGNISIRSLKKVFIEDVFLGIN